MKKYIPFLFHFFLIVAQEYVIIVNNNFEKLLATFWIVLPLAISAFVSCHLLRIKNAYFYFSVTSVALVGVLAVFLQNAYSWLPNEHESQFVSVVMIVWAVAMIMLVFAIPVIALPGLRKRFSVDQTTVLDNISLAFLSDSVASIKANFRSVEESVRKETLKINHALEEFEGVVKTQEAELKIAKLKLEEAQEEANYYRELSQLTKAQQDVFLRLMSRGKYVDYLVGFGLGVLSSLLVEMAKALFGVGV